MGRRGRLRWIASAVAQGPKLSSVPVPGLRSSVQQRSDGVLNGASLPSGIIAFVVSCRLRYRLTLRDLSEIML